MESMKTALWMALASPIPVTYALDITSKVQDYLLDQEEEVLEEFFLDNLYHFQKIRFMTSFGKFIRLKLDYVYDVLHELYESHSPLKWTFVQSPLILVDRLALAVREQDLIHDEAWIIDRTLLLKAILPGDVWREFPVFAANCAMRNRRIAYVATVVDNLGAGLEHEEDYFPGEPPQAWIAVRNLWRDTKPEAMDVDDDTD